MLVRVTCSLGAVAARIADSLVHAAPERGPSAAAVAVSDADGEPLTVIRGDAQILDCGGRPVARIPLPQEPVFDVGAVTKVAATTALCMCLVEDGRLSLDSLASQWLPDFTGDHKDAVTVRDLLEHQGGLWEWWPTYLDGAATARDALSVARELPLRHAPHTGRRYSDLGFMLLGEIVARAYGEPLDVIARRRIFRPLGMHDTGYRGRDVAASTDRVVATSLGDWYERRMVETGSPYPVSPDSGAFTGWRRYTLVGEANDGNCWHAFGGVAGHAGLFTTVTDLLRLGGALLAGLQGHGLWSADVAREFFRPGRDSGQGLGFWIRHSEYGTVVQHSGFPGARFAVLPQRNRVAVLLTNRLHTTGEPATVDGAWDELVEAVEAA